ncbi:MAG: F0F1 ATP synthase subunit B [Gammaproteobacteria bacterium RIFCSPLOWO2_02_FULL_61_13]|nr:MAG: F0F1 ATP synthase subunit B [Gammaproteobacteria bacterium RIFCSPLOWO2_02_FULL_61_13]
MNINATLFGQAITFAILVWFTMKFVWPPIMKAMQERAQRIADGLAAADEGRRKFTQAEQLFQEKLTEGKQQSAVILAQAHKRGDEMIEEAKSTARVEGGRIIEAARHEIAREREQVREQLKQQVAALALAGAEQILMREVDRKSHDDLLGKIGSSL